MLSVVPKKLEIYIIIYNIVLLVIQARLAQSVERWTLNPTVVGSSPTLGLVFILYNYFTHD